MGTKLLDSCYLALAAFILWAMIGNIYHLRNDKRKVMILVAGIAAIFAAAFLGSVPTSWVVVFELLLPFLLVRDQFWHKAINILIAFFSVGVFEDIYRIIMMIVSKKAAESSVGQLVCLVLTFVTLWLIFQTRNYRNIGLYTDRIQLKTKLLCLLTMVVTMLMISFGVVMLRNSGKDAEISIFLGLALTTMLLASILILNLFNETHKQLLLLKENAVKESVINEQSEIYNLLAEKNNETRMFRHDIRNHLGALKLLLESGDLNNARTYLQDMYEENESLSVKRVYFGDDILDVVVAMMCWRAGEKNIDISVTGDIYKEKLNTYDLCGIFLNAIGNAVEACTAQGIRGPIEIAARKSEAMQLIVFTNPATEEMYRNILDGKTSKSDASIHGIGTKNIRQAAVKLGGEAVYEYEDGILKLMITIEF